MLLLPPLRRFRRSINSTQSLLLLATWSSGIGIQEISLHRDPLWCLLIYTVCLNEGSTIQVWPTARLERTGNPHMSLHIAVVFQTSTRDSAAFQYIHIPFWVLDVIRVPGRCATSEELLTFVLEKLNKQIFKHTGALSIQQLSVCSSFISVYHAFFVSGVPLFFFF